MKHLKFKMPKRVWMPAIVAVLALAVICGGALAAINLVFHGSVEVVSDGGTGGGGGGGTPPVLAFEVYDALEDGSLVTDAYFVLGSINTEHTVDLPVYIENTGTGEVTVHVSVAGLEYGTLDGLGDYVVPVGTIRTAVPLVFTAGVTASGGLDTYDVSFDIVTP